MVKAISADTGNQRQSCKKSKQALIGIEIEEEIKTEQQHLSNANLLGKRNTELSYYDCCRIFVERPK